MEGVDRGRNSKNVASEEGLGSQRGGCSQGGASVSGNMIMLEPLGFQFSDQQESGGDMTLATKTSASEGRLRL